MQKAKGWVVMPAGCDMTVENDCEDVEVVGTTEIYLGEVLALQLLDIPKDTFALGVVTPPEMDPAIAQTFKDNVHTAWFGVKSTMKTIETLFPVWLGNALKNYNWLTSVKPVNELRKIEGTTKALVVGNGPSLTAQLPLLKQLNLDKVAVFTCWHSAHKLLDAGIKVDYVCHTDHEAPPFDFKNRSFPFSTIFIATPKADPTFVAMSQHYETYTYIPMDNPLCTYFAEPLKCTEHKPIHTTVVSMMEHCAEYAGYDEIGLLGVDSGWLPDQPDYPGVTEPVEITNQHGVTIKTFSVFALAAYGLEQQLKGRPVKVYQMTKNALDIGGVTYKPIEEFVEG